MLHRYLRPLMLAAAFSALALPGLPARAAATLFHYYDFNNGSTVTDLVGSMNGTLMDNANVSGGLLNLDGAGDYVQFTNHLIPIAGSYSFAFFARRDSFNGLYTEMISQGSSGGPGQYLGSDPGGNIRAGDLWGATGVPMGAVGAMTHYALTVDAAGSTSSLYVNGLLAAQVPFALIGTPGGSDARLGSQFAPYAEYFHGAIDELRIYDGVLTPGEVLQLATPVPEPASALLMAAGLVWWAARGGRKWAKKARASLMSA